MQKLVFLILSILFIGCTEERVESKIAGSWIILYPEHQLDTDAERTVYAQVQDSISETKSLRLVSFGEDQSFYRVEDIFDHSGQWLLAPDQNLMIKNGGAGFGDFTAQFSSAPKADEMLLTEQVFLMGQSIQLDWHCKKLEQEKDLWLMEEANNRWRIRAGRRETVPEVRARVVSMLDYAFHYLDLISRSSSFFIGSSIPLPFSYYQHGIGLEKDMKKNGFNNYFFDEDNLGTAQRLLSRAFEEIRQEDFPDGGNYLDEYAELYRLISAHIKNPGKKAAPRE